MARNGISVAFKSNSDTVARNFARKSRRMNRELGKIVTKWGEKFYAATYVETPRGESGNMRKLLKLRYTPQKLNFQVGWWERDFASEGLRFYPLYVVLGTSRAAANPVLTRVERMLRPGFKQEFINELRRYLGGRR